MKKKLLPRIEISVNDGDSRSDTKVGFLPFESRAAGLSGRDARARESFRRTNPLRLSTLIPLRVSEWMLVSFFAILLLYSWLLLGKAESVMKAAERLLVLASILAAILAGQRFRPGVFWEYLRDWTTLAWVLVSYRSMDWFAPAVPLRRWEDAWVRWDRVLLAEWGFRDAIEVLGPLLPSVLEIAYSLVYGLAAFCLAVIYIHRRRSAIGYFLSVYLAGLYASYLQFPFWPSEPPWTVFPGELYPQVETVFREFNEWVLRGAGIHTSVFPSAHVSGAVAAALAIWMIFPRKPRLRWGIATYAVLVTVATVYGRYHYAIDAIAGIAVGAIAWVVTDAIWQRTEGKNSGGKRFGTQVTANTADRR